MRSPLILAAALSSATFFAQPAMAHARGSAAVLAETESLQSTAARESGRAAYSQSTGV